MEIYAGKYIMVTSLYLVQARMVKTCPKKLDRKKKNFVQ